MKKIVNIIKEIEANYKRTKIENASLDGDYLVMKCVTSRSSNYPFIALRILNSNPEIRVVHFTGGWIESVYTRETLRWGGYKVKEHKG